MRSLLQFFVFSGGLSMLLLFAGLYKPWLVLWWRSKQNRRRVLQLYGSLMMLSVVGYLMLAMLIR